MINNRRHTEKVLCSLMVFNAIVGCTSNMKHLSEDILKYVKAVLEAEKDEKKRARVLRNARAVERKLFKPVVDTCGNLVVGIICKTLNTLQDEGFEIFDADDYIYDMFEVVLASCRFSGKDMEQVNIKAAEWVSLIRKEGYFR